MAKSSIHIQGGKIGFFSHNSRESKTVNAIFKDESNYISCDNKTAIKNFKDELELRTLKYLKNHTSRTKLHSKTLTHLSAIVNFNKEHTPEDNAPTRSTIRLFHAGLLEFIYSPTVDIGSRLYPVNTVLKSQNVKLFSS